MALPQRRDEFENNEAQLRELNRERLIEARRSAGFGWMWLWWLFFIVIIFGWFGGWGYGGYGGWWGWGGQRAVPVQSANTNSNAILGATNRQAFLGKNIELTNSQVLHGVTDNVLWVGPRDEQSLLVVLSGAANTTKNAGVGNGDQVNVTGTVEKAPSAEQAKQQWHLNDDGAKRLEQQGVYLSASQVEKVNR